MTTVKHSGRTTERVSGINDDLEAVFAEAATKAAERDGFAVRVCDRRFEVWPSRFTYRQKMRIHDHAGMTIEAATAMRGSAPIEALATFIFASMFYESGVTPKMDGIVAWLTSVIEASDEDVPVEWIELPFDEAADADPLEPCENSL
jgi:hypothetical protein